MTADGTESLLFSEIQQKQSFINQKFITSQK